MRDSQSLTRRRRCRSRCLPSPVPVEAGRVLGVAGARARGAGRVLRLADAGARSRGAVLRVAGTDAGGVGASSRCCRNRRRWSWSSSPCCPNRRRWSWSVLGVAGTDRWSGRVSRAGQCGPVPGVGGARPGGGGRVARCARTGRRRCRRLRSRPHRRPHRRVGASGGRRRRNRCDHDSRPRSDRSSRSGPRRVALDVCSSGSPPSCSERRA